MALGGFRFKKQEFNRTAVLASGSTLFLAAVALTIPSILPLTAPTLSEGNSETLSLLVALCMLGSGFLLAWETWRKQKNPDSAAPERKPGDGTARAATGHRPNLVLLAMAAWTALYYTAFEPVGYIVSTTIYLSALLFYFHRVNPLINLACAAAFTAVAYVLFTDFLQVVLPSGILQL